MGEGSSGVGLSLDHRGFLRGVRAGRDDPGVLAEDDLGDLDGAFALTARAFFRSRIALARSLSGNARMDLVFGGSFSKISAWARFSSSSISRGRNVFHRSNVTQ